MSKIDHPITVAALRKRAASVATLCSTALDDLGKSRRIPELMSDADAKLHRNLPGALVGHLRKVRAFEQYLRTNVRGQRLDVQRLKDGRSSLTQAKQAAEQASRLLGHVSDEAVDKLELSLAASLGDLSASIVRR